MSRVPRIRFKGFEEDWEQRKLGEIAERIIRKNEKLESTLPLTISAQYGLIDQNEFFDKRIASKDVRGYYLIKKGEFAYNKSTSVDAPFGAIKRLDKYKNGVLSTLYILFKIIDDTSTGSDYLVTYYATDLWHRGIQSIAAEGARNHGLLNIAPNDFFETMLSIPLNISEQKKVGDFFISLDYLITLHQRKLQKLKIIKKSMLENLFPQNGEKTPKIRFSGFTKDWEQRKLGELADIIGGGTPSTLNLDYWDGNIDWYSPAEIIDQIYVDRSQRKITELGFENSSAKMLPEGTVLFTSRAGIGKTAILAKKGCTNQGFQSIVPYSNKLDSYFIFSRTEELKKYGELVGAGSTFVEVSGRQMENMQLMIPKTIGEQHIIGVLFSTFDNLITLHQSKLEKLQKIKKSMLESMFI